MDFKYRLATEKDLTKILWIFNDVILNTTAIYQNAIMTEGDIKAWWEIKKTLKLPVFVAELNEEVVGFTSYGPFRQREGYRRTVELAIHIDPRYRRQGLGKKLLSMLIEKAKVDKLHVMIAGIDSENVGSIILHENLGFEICGELKQVARKFDRWLDLTFMQLILK